MRTSTSTLHFVLAAIGLVATWVFNLQYFADGGSVAPGAFFGSAFANALTTAITVDVYWSALVFSVWAVLEHRRKAAPSPWWFIAACFTLGLAFAFPLYLGWRARTDMSTQRLQGAS